LNGHAWFQELRVVLILTETYEMVQRKPYNPNTAYGRRKLRVQARENFEKLPPENRMNIMSMAA
jgi:hypothetical protein